MRLLTSLLLLSQLGLAAVGHGDFSGTWKMDSARSESAHQEAPVTAATLVIQVNADDISVETTRTEAGRETAFHETLHFKADGSETTAVGDGGREVVGKARWDGPKLVLETVRNINDSTVTTLYVHALSADGKRMTIDKTLTVQHGYQGQAAKNSGHGVDVFVKVSK